jgi:hypothetical protein
MRQRHGVGGRADARLSRWTPRQLAAGVGFICFVLLALAAPHSAGARLNNLIPATADGDPTDTFRADDALFTYTTSDFKGGTACIVNENIGDVSDGSASCDTPAWGSPNVIFGIGTLFQALEGPFLYVGTWRLLGDGGSNPGDDTLSQPFYVVPCADTCDPTIAQATIDHWKAGAAPMEHGMGEICSKAASQAVRVALRPGLLPDAYAIWVLRNVACRAKAMYADIVADPVDPSYTSVQPPSFQSIPPLDFPGAHDLAQSVEAQKAYGRAELKAFERYEGALQDSATPYVHLQTAAIAEYGAKLVQEMRNSAGLLQQEGDALAADPDTSGPIVANQQELDDLTALQARVRDSGFTDDETSRLLADGFSSGDITQLRTDFGDTDLSGLQIGEDMKTVLDDAAAATEPQAQEFDAFAREASSVAAVTQGAGGGQATVDSIGGSCSGDVLRADAVAFGDIGSPFSITLYSKTGDGPYTSTALSHDFALTSVGATLYSHDFDISSLPADSYKVVSSTGVESNEVPKSWCGPGSTIPEAPAALLLPLSLLGLLGIATGALYLRRRSSS